MMDSRPARMTEPSLTPTPGSGVPPSPPVAAPPISVPLLGPLVEARFLERPNRFLMLARLAATGEVVAAHLADPGRLRELLLPGRRIWLRPEGGPAVGPSASPLMLREDHRRELAPTGRV